MMPAKSYASPALFGWFTAVFIAASAAAILAESLFLLALPFALLIFYSGWMQPFTFFLILIASLPWSVEFNFTPALGTDLPDEPLMLMATLLAAGIYLYKPAGSYRQKKMHPLVFLLLIHIAWIGVTVLFSTRPVLSLKLWVAKSWYLGAFVWLPLLLINSKEAVRKTALAFCGSMLILTILSLLRHAQTGFSFATINEAVAPFFSNHVNYSAMLIATLPVIAAFYKSSPAEHKKKWLAALIMVLAATFFSYARGAWLALLMAGMAVWLTRRKLIVPAMITAIAIAVAGIAWLKTDNRYVDYAHDYKTTIFHPDFKEHLIATYRMKDVSTAERFYRWVAGIRMIGKKPLTGFGPGTFYTNYAVYTVSAFRTWVSDNNDHSTVHNYFLLLLIEQGWPGLLFFLVLLGYMFAAAQQLYHHGRDAFCKTAALVITSVLSMVVTVNLLSDLIETDKVGSLFFLCLSMLVILQRMNQATETNPS